MTKRTTDNRIQDEGDLKKFRTEQPNLIYDLRLTPFEYTLYGYLKKTAGAGPDGRCFKSAETLSLETGMSEGMISRAKKGLLRTDRPGLRGKALIRLEKDNSHAGRPRDVITIIDIWRENFRHYDALYGADDDDVAAGDDAQQSAGPEHQSSLHEDQRSPGDLQRSPGDLQRSPQRSLGDPNNRKESKKESGEEEREENAPAPSTDSSNTDLSNTNSNSSAAASAPASPPSLEDVRCQLREIGQSESHAEKFHAYYDDRGWTSGRDNRPVGDWRKKLALWVIREPEFGPASTVPQDAESQMVPASPRQHKPGQQGLTLQDRSQNTLDALNKAGL